MKKQNFYLFLSLILCTSVFAQSEKEVKHFIERYESDMKKGDFAKSLDYIYPKLYDVIPRETMKEALVQAFLDTSMFKMSFDKFKVAHVGEVFTEGKISYAFADYSITMRMDFINPETTAQEIEEMGKVMQQVYGAENVEIKPRRFTITTQNKMAVIKDLATGQLYLLEISDQLKPVFESMMSADFVERAF